MPPKGPPPLPRCPILISNTQLGIRRCTLHLSPNSALLALTYSLSTALLLRELAGCAVVLVFSLASSQSEVPCFTVLVPYFINPNQTLTAGLKAHRRVPRPSGRWAMQLSVTVTSAFNDLGRAYEFHTRQKSIKALHSRQSTPRLSLAGPPVYSPVTLHRSNVAFDGHTRSALRWSCGWCSYPRRTRWRAPQS